MLDRDPNRATLTPSQADADRYRYEQALASGLQPWAVAAMQDRTRSRFGGFERQIEAEVLQSLARFGR